MKQSLLLLLAILMTTVSFALQNSSSSENIQPSTSTPQFDKNEITMGYGGADVSHKISGSVTALA